MIHVIVAIIITIFNRLILFFPLLTFLDGFFIQADSGGGGGLE